MQPTTRQQRQSFQHIDRDALARHQLQRLNALLDSILPQNRFYGEKLAGCRLPIEDPGALGELPLTTKEELVVSAEQDGCAANRTFPLDAYARFHQTSGTRGRPLVVLDTADDWRWWIECWQHVLDAADVGPEDRAMLAFSFGPFIGFWSAHDALVARGAMVIPGGGMSTPARLHLIETSGATALFCTPSYALRMAEVAGEEGVDLASSPVRCIVVAGEPGGSLPAVRAAIERAWDATVIDHAGATEVGAWGYGDADGRGLVVNESEFIAELLEVDSDRPAAPDQLAELVLTTLGRAGSPVIRYRTGDLVRPRVPDCGFLLLEGGILGRSDDMLVIRGVNIFPSSIDEILRGFPEVAEYRMIASRANQLDQIAVEVETRTGDARPIAKQLELRLGLRVEVCSVPVGSLPRFEGKGGRFVDERTAK